MGYGNADKSAIQDVQSQRDSAVARGQFTDNRFSALAQLQLQRAMDSSPGVILQRKVQESMQSSFVTQRQAWSRGAVDNKSTDVDWKVGKLGGDTVGVEMTANPLGPEHLQGGPPKSGAQNSLMNKLPTDPSLSNPDKYIRGHLLNDNVGGPGDDFNLFPITANANKEHERVIESKVKSWVNDEKQWVFYTVKVDSINDQLKNGYVNANFNCEASILDPTNNKKLQTISAQINSIYSKNLSTDEKNAADGGVRAVKGSQASSYAPLLSKSKKLQQLMDEETLLHLSYLLNDNKDGGKLLRKALLEYQGIGNGTIDSLRKWEPDNEIAKTVKSAITRVVNNIGENDLLDIISDIYDEIM